LLNAPVYLREQLHRANDRLLQRFIHLPEHRSRLLFDLDSTVVTSFGHQEGAEVGYNPRYRGKRSYDPLLCVEANSSFLWDVELRRGDAGTWAGSEQLNIASSIRREKRRLFCVCRVMTWHWQLWYNLATPIALPKGTRIDCTAHFDNSPNNPDNADPTKEVTWGDQSWDEMMVGFFDLTFPADMPVQNIFLARKDAKGAGGQ
jgi:hypothetical protein